MVDYTQDYMRDTFAEFLNHMFCENVQEGLVDSRSGKDLIMILRKPLYVLI